MPDEDTTDQTDQTADETQEDTSETAKTYTQAELDAIIERRLSRERQRYGDYKDLKAKADRLSKIEEASKSEMERAVESARREGVQTAMQQYTERLARAEAKALAAAAKFRDPLDAVTFLSDIGSHVTEDGEVNTKSLNAALAELAKSKPYLLVEEKPTRPTGDAGQGPRVSSGPANMNDLIRAQAGIRITP